MTRQQPAQEEIRQFGKSIISWSRDNPRPMPWKNFSDPYHIWIAEIILQQTRVDQGSPYFERFIHHFPDLKTLAESSEEEVLVVWEGLGYYSRARNLHATARYVWKELEGEFPKTAADLQRLKGIGPYTAAAIASFAYGEAIGVVDGNVKRVLSRYFYIDEAVDQPKVKRQMQQLVNRVVEVFPSADFNQAIMNFGALACLPRRPVCESCLLRDECRAYLLGVVDELPVKSRSPVKQDMTIDFGVYVEAGKIALTRNGTDSIWKNLFLFPALGQDQVGKIERRKPGKRPLLKYALHDEMAWVLTHRNLKIFYYKLDEWPDEWQEKSEISMVAWENLDKYAIPRPLRLFLKQNSIKLGIKKEG